MNVRDAIETRIEVREYVERAVDEETRRRILDAARLAPSGKNLQHWAFVLVDGADDVDHLADVSTTGEWVRGADFAVVVLTDPDYPYHGIDAGRAVTHMQLAAWEEGVGSCIYTGFDEERMRAFLDYPDGLTATLVAGFGYPHRPVEEYEGRKDRAPLDEVVHEGRYGAGDDR